MSPSETSERGARQEDGGGAACRRQSARRQSPLAARLLAAGALALLPLALFAASAVSLAPPPPPPPPAASSSAPLVQAAPPAAKHETIKVNFTDCGAKNIKEVRITPCPGDGSVCNINLGTNVTVEADFVAKHEASSLTEIIKGIIRGRELQFPEQRADPCKSTIQPHCPIKPGKHYQYRASFEVKPHYPAIPVKVRYALANANGDIVACVQISAKIVDPSPVRSSRNKPKKKT